MGQKAWNVILDDEILDTVFYAPNMSADEVERSLILHDSYHPQIRVVEETHPLVTFLSWQESARRAWSEDENKTLEFLDAIGEDFSCPDCLCEYFTGWDIPARKVICNSCGARVQL